MNKKELKKFPKTVYCEYYLECDKEYDCANGNFCSVFTHTKSFSSIKDSGPSNAQLEYFKRGGR